MDKVSHVFRLGDYDNIGKCEAAHEIKSGIFGQTHKAPSHLDFHCLKMCVRIYLMSKFTRLDHSRLTSYHI